MSRDTVLDPMIVKCRYEVFTDEQGYSREQEVDEYTPVMRLCSYDDVALHLLALDGVTPIGTVRLVYPPAIEKYKLGRLAVRKVGRGRRIGQMLVAALEIVAREMGATEVYAGSQVPVVGFYEKSGYHAVGEEYLDEGQPHMMMVKTVK